MDIIRNKCMYCGACVSVCPQRALTLKEIFIDIHNACNNCGICAKICPANAIV